MRIALVSQEYPPDTGWGGIGSYTFAMAHALAAEGAEVHVVSCVEDQAPTVADDGPVVVHRSGPPGRGPIGWRARPHVPQVETRWGVARGVARALRAIRPDVVEAPDWMAEGLLGGLRPRVPLVVHIHSPLDLVTAHRHVRPSADTRLAGLMERVAVRRAAAVTAADPEVLRFPDGRRWTARPVHRLPPPIPADVASAPERPPAGRSGGAATVAMVGRIDRLKSPETLLAALAAVRDRVPSVRAVLAGHSNRVEAPGGGDYSGWLRSEAARSGLEVDLPGRLGRPAVLELYRTVDVVVVPSLYESFSMTALEAMASGTPVIVSSACGIASYLSGLGPGWVVPPGDASALADALVARLAEPAPTGEAGRRARALARETFDSGRLARRRMSLYGSLI